MAKASGIALLAYPSFLWLTSNHLPRMIAARVLLTLFVACYMGPFFAAVTKLFPTSQRYTGLSVSYNIEAALFSGTAPLVATFHIEWSGNVFAPTFYLSFCATVSLAIILTLRNRGLAQAAPLRYGRLKEKHATFDLFIPGLKNTQALSTENHACQRVGRHGWVTRVRCWGSPSQSCVFDFT